MAVEIYSQSFIPHITMKNIIFSKIDFPVKEYHLHQGWNVAVDQTELS